MDENPFVNPTLPPLGNDGDPAPKDMEENTLGIVCHLLALTGLVIPFGGGILGPLVLWLIKRADSPYLDAVGKEAVNFNLSWLIYAAIAFLSVFVLIGFLLLPLVGLGWLIFVVIAAIKASGGKIYRYPLTIRFIK